MVQVDWSARGRARVYTCTVLGTAGCIAAAFVLDSFSFIDGTWRWGSNPLSNLIIPLLIAPPIFLYLLSRMRLLSIAHQELAQLAATDSMTQMLNRRAFSEKVERLLQRTDPAGGYGTDALLVIDVDHFKQVNDCYGHDAGDDALVLIAEAIRGCLCTADLAGRLGGEEFALFLPGQPPDSVANFAERLRQAVRNIRFSPEGKPHPLTISVGGIIFDGAPTFRELYRRTDKQLYLAKHNGRDRVELKVVARDTVEPA
ncbi:GGDEF domain-containing protein [Roseibium sp. M-1]